jgi:hypothetical protein
MQTEEHNNGQRSPPSVPKTGPYLQRTIKVVLGCQTINGINPRSAIRQQQHLQNNPKMEKTIGENLNLPVQNRFIFGDSTSSFKDKKKSALYF